MLHEASCSVPEPCVTHSIASPRYAVMHATSESGQFLEELNVLGPVLGTVCFRQ